MIDSFGGRPNLARTAALPDTPQHRNATEAQVNGKF